MTLTLYSAMHHSMITQDSSELHAVALSRVPVPMLGRWHGVHAALAIAVACVLALLEALTLRFRLPLLCKDSP